MRFLITNDDGISAPGIATLAQAASQRGEVVIVAPVGPCSGCGHQVTTHRALGLLTQGADRYAVDGWPVDCVRVATRGLGIQADWVLSGINAGGNMGADVYISGTVAAIREAVLLNNKGIAFSYYKRRDLDFDWPRAGAWARKILDLLIHRPCPPRSFWNVNFPHLTPEDPDPAVVECPLDPQALPIQYRREGDLLTYFGDYHQRPRDPGSDVDICMSGRIAISLLSL